MKHNSFATLYLILLLFTGWTDSFSQVAWKFLGPDSMPAFEGTGMCPNGMGLISALHVDPSDPARIFAGSNTGGLFMTTDGGKNWKCVTDNDIPQVTGIGCVIANPANPGILYIGTGLTSYNREYGHGIWKSDNGGLDWKPTGLFFDPERKGDPKPVVKKIVIHPASPAVIYAILKNDVGSWVYRSGNFGKKWKIMLEVKGEAFFDMEFLPSDPNTIYVGGRKFYVSRDGGKSWTSSSLNAPGKSQIYRVALAVHNDHPQMVWALYETESAGNNILLSISEDAGISFRSVSAFNTGQLSVGMWKMELEVAPRDTSVIFVGGVYMHKSVNGGRTFFNISSARLSDPDWLHVDARFMKIYRGEESDVLYVGHDGGISRITTADKSWEHLNGRGLSITQFWGMGLSPADGSLAGGTQDLGIEVFDGKGWTNTGMYGDAYDCIFHPNSPDTIYALANSGMPGMRSTRDGGKTWDYMRMPGQHSLNDRPFIMHPTRPEVLYVGHHDVFMTQDAGGSWKNISDFTEEGFGVKRAETLKAIAQAASDPDVIYAAYGTPCWSDNTSGKIFRTDDNGKSWKDITPGLEGARYAGISDITVSPLNPLRVWVCVDGFSIDDSYVVSKVFMTSDGGNTWSNLSSGLPNYPCTRIFCAGDEDETLLLGTDAGMYYKKKNMSRWASLNGNLPKAIISGIEIDASRKRLVVSTYGRGVWETSFPLKTN